jgi:hypothetical protein
LPSAPGFNSDFSCRRREDERADAAQDAGRDVGDVDMTREVRDSERREDESGYLE